MGQRANYIIIENGETEIYYHKWDADKLGYNLSNGLEPLKRHIINNCQEQENILDNVWAEGSMIINQDKQEIIFFDGLLGLEYVFLKEVLFKMINQTILRSWKIKWAMLGQIEIAKYLNIELHDVINLNAIKLSKPRIKEKPIINPSYSTLTIIKKRNFSEFYLLPYHIETILNNDIDEIYQIIRNFDPINYDKLNRSEIYEFIFFDIDRNELNIYFSYPSFIGEKLKSFELWREWKLNFIEKGYEWLDNKIGKEFKLREDEFKNIKKCLKHVYLNKVIKPLEENSIDFAKFKRWIIENKYDS